MKKRKVLFVVHQLNYGGVQKALISALNAIDYTENEVTLYIRKNRIQLLSEVNSNVRQIIVNEDKTHYYRKPYVIMLLFIKKIYRMLKLKNKNEIIEKELIRYINESQMKYEQRHYFEKQDEYDVAISYIQGYNAKFVAQYIKAKKKIMFFHRSMDENHTLHKEVMPCFDVIVGINEVVKKMLCESYPEIAKKITFVDNYMNEKEVRKKSKEFKIEKKENELIICSCGRITPEKGYLLAVETAKILKENNVEFFWYFVGDGSQRMKIEKLIQLYGLEKNIKITGMQDNPYPYISSCDVYVQPSYEESFGITILEAKMLNKPIVSTKTVGAKIQIQHEGNGVLSEIDSAEIAKAIIRYITDEDFKNNIIETLKQVDYQNEYKRVQRQWRNLIKE